MRSLGFLPILALLTAFISGCGKDPNNSQTASPNGLSRPVSENPTSPGDTPEMPSNPDPTSLIHTTSISLLGSQSSQTHIETQDLLKATISPKPNENADYGCVSFRVEIGSTVFNTGILRVEGVDSGNCPGAETSFQIDFSAFLPSGANAVDISVSAQQNDKLCYTNGIRCPAFQIGSNDQVRGQLTTETNLP